MQNKAIGGKSFLRICKNCKEWQIGGQCNFWKHYKYGFLKACGYFMARDDEQSKSNNS